MISISAFQLYALIALSHVLLISARLFAFMLIYDFYFFVAHKLLSESEVIFS